MSQGLKVDAIQEVGLVQIAHRVEDGRRKEQFVEDVLVWALRQ